MKKLAHFIIVNPLLAAFILGVSIAIIMSVSVFIPYAEIYKAITSNLFKYWLQIAGFCALIVLVKLFITPKKDRHEFDD